MLRFVSIRSRLVGLSLLLVGALILSNLLLIHQNRQQSALIQRQANDINVIVMAGNAVATFGNLKYWLTDLAVSQLTLSRQKAQFERERFENQLDVLGAVVPGSVRGLSEQVSKLAADSIAAADAYSRGDRLVGNAMVAKGRAHILAVDSKLSTLVSQVQSSADLNTKEALERSVRGIHVAVTVVVSVALISTFLTFSVVTSVVSPLRQLVRVIDEMVAGDMRVDIPSGSRDEIGAMERVLRLFRDSVRRREEVERRFATIIDNVPATVFLRDLQGRFLVVNRYYAEFYGLSYESIAGSTNRDLFYERLAAESDAHDTQVIETHEVVAREVTFERPDGEVSVLWSIKFPVLDANAEMLSLGGIELDITERKRTEALLRQANEATAAAERRLAAAVENMSEAIVVYDENDRLVLCNTRFKEFYGYSDEDVRPGVAYSNLSRLDVQRGLIISDDRHRYLQLRDQHRSRLAGTLDVELRGGRWLQIRERLTGEKHIVSIQADVTERKRAELELYEAKEEAELASQTKSQFLANMSHELRTPLNAIIGITEMLMEDGKPDADQVEPLTRIHGAGTQLLSLINEILDLSKIEAGRMEIVPNHFDVTELVEDVVQTASSLAEKNHNRLVLEATTSLGVCYLDETRVRQIVFNLVGNACKFSERSEIRVRLNASSHDEREGICLGVSDSGIGMDPGQLDRLFNPFSQGDASTSRRYGGTGLGLAITKHFCQMMGGWIEVESELGVGSTFTVWLPRSMDNPGE